MKYSISEENKTKALNKNRIFMALNYGVGMLVAAYVLVEQFIFLPANKSIFFLSIFIMVPLAWIYFDRRFKTRLNTEYEIDDEKLTIIENGIIVKTTLLKSISSITKIPQGYRIISDIGKFYIVNMVENNEELLRELKKYTTNYQS